METSALLLGGVGYGSAGVPSIYAGVLQALLIAVTLMQLSGPVWALFGPVILQRALIWARESPEQKNGT